MGKRVTIDPFHSFRQYTVIDCILCLIFERSMCEESDVQRPVSFGGHFIVQLYQRCELGLQ